MNNTEDLKLLKERLINEKVLDNLQAINNYVGHFDDLFKLCEIPESRIAKEIEMSLTSLRRRREDPTLWRVSELRLVFELLIKSK